MNIQTLIDRVKNGPAYDRVGMILCHTGVVRATSRDGRRVRGLRVAVDHRRLADIVADGRQREGIVDILVEINEEKDLTVGDDVMLLVVAGDIRERVLGTMEATLNAIKTEATKKIETFA